MNPTSDVLKRITNSSQNHQDGVFTRLYRYLLREDIYLTAYKICMPMKAQPQREQTTTPQTGSAKYI